MTAGSPVMNDMSVNARDALIDVALWLYHGFFAPADHVLSFLSTHAPRLAQFLALDTVGHESMLSGLISGVVWLGAIILIVAAYRLVRDLDRALAAFTGRLYEGLLRTGRVVARRLTIALRTRALKRQARLTRIEISEQAELSALELVVLRAHAELAPHHLLTASYIASAFDVPSSDVEQALATLERLSLVQRTFGTGDGETGYRLTRPGEVFLGAPSRAHPTKGLEGRRTQDQGRKRERAEPIISGL
jgi:DNA-binding MarR family transcriptional regulator